MSHHLRAVKPDEAPKAKAITLRLTPEQYLILKLAAQMESFNSPTALVAHSVASLIEDKRAKVKASMGSA